MSSSRRQTLVLFPSINMGHLIPMVELAKHFVKHHHHLSVTIFVVDHPHSTSVNNSYISRVSAAHPSISFHRVSVDPPQLDSHPFVATFQLLRRAISLLKSFLASQSEALSVRALVLDMFCTFALDVAKEFEIPAYIFFPSNASCLIAFVLTPEMQSQAEASFRELGEEPLHFPGLPPIPASHMPFHLQDRGSELYEAFTYHLKRLPMADGIMINTFEALEGRAVEALRDGSCYPGRPMPPIFCVGPIVADREQGEGERHECLAWLDAQPRGSVVFLSFGSMGGFGKEQLREIATGLERSGQRFLWVVRSPPDYHDPKKWFEPRPEAELQELLPEGFLERTEGTGLVVKSWAPQVAVLLHDAVGGFVTHCGWNSTLEVVCEGMPMIAWPLYAEQKLNKVFLVAEAGLAVEMKGYHEELVRAVEVEEKLRWLIESEGGREMKARAIAMKEMARAAGEEGGSSATAWAELLKALNF